MNYQKLLNQGTNFLKTGNIVKPEFDCELLLGILVAQSTLQKGSIENLAMALSVYHAKIYIYIYIYMKCGSDYLLPRKPAFVLKNLVLRLIYSQIQEMCISNFRTMLSPRFVRSWKKIPHPRCFLLFLRLRHTSVTPTYKVYPRFKILYLLEDTYLS